MWRLIIIIIKCHDSCEDNVMQYSRKDLMQSPPFFDKRMNSFMISWQEQIMDFPMSLLVLVINISIFFGGRAKGPWLPHNFQR